MIRIRPRRPLGLKGRAAILLAAGLLLGGLVTVLFFYNLSQISHAYQRADTARQQLADSRSLLLAMTQEDAALDGYAATGDDRMLADLAGSRQDADAAFASLSREITDAHERQLLTEMAGDRAQWDALLLARRPAPGDADLAAQVHALFDHLSGDAGVLEGELQADYASAHADALRATTTAQVAGLIGAGIGAVALLLLGRLFLASTLSPLLALLATAQRMASGQVVGVPATERRDEVGALARALVAWDHTARRQGALERRAQETENRYQHLFQRAPVGIARADLESRIQEVNPALADMAGLDRRALRRSSLADLLETADPGAVAEACESVASGEAATRNVLGRRVCPDGSVRWLEMAVSTLPGIRGQRAAGLVAMFEDVTDIQRHLDRLRAINRIGQAILEGRPMTVVEQIIAENARELVDADLAGVAIAGGPGEDLVVQAAVGHGQEAYQGLRIPRTGSLAGQALMLGEPVISTDVHEDPRAATQLIAGLDVGAFAGAPIAQDGVVLVMNRTGGRQFEPADVELLGTFASQAALAFEYERSQAHLRQLRLLEDRERIAKDLQDSVIQSLFGIGLTLQAASLRANAADVAERIDAAEAELDVTIRRMRNLVFGLTPELDADRHLDMALRQLAEEFALSSGARVDTDVDKPLAAQLSSAASALLDLARRALAPTGSFAGSRAVSLSLHRSDGHAVLEIGSDRLDAPLDAIDLPALRAAVRDVGGRVELRPGTSRRGAALRVRVPVEKG